MIVANLHSSFNLPAVVDGVDSGYRVPVHAIDFEFVTDQVLGVSDDNAVCLWIEINNVAWSRRTAGQPFALTDCEKLDPVVSCNEISIDIVNLATMKLRFANMRTQKCLLIVAGHEADFLAVDLIRDFQA